MNDNSLHNNILIEIKDKYGEFCIGESNSKNIKEKRGPQGFVEIYELDENKNKKLISKSNLVTYCGREWLLERMFNIENSNITSTKDQYLCWFGLGDAGAPAGDPLNPTSPTNDDTALGNEIPINSSDSTCADYHDGAYYKHPFDSLGYEQDISNGNSYLIGKITITVGADDAVGENISEAALYIAESNAGGYSGDFNLYARTTFPTQVKTATRILTFVWYIYV